MCIVYISEYICQLINFLVEKLVGGDGGGATRGGSAECGRVSRIRKFQESNEIDQRLGIGMQRTISIQRRLGIRQFEIM